MRGLRSLSGAAVVAQIDDEWIHVRERFHVPNKAITTYNGFLGISDAFREARNVINRAIIPQWVWRCVLSGQMTFRFFEAIWESSEDANLVVLLEAVSLTSSLEDRPECGDVGRSTDSTVEHTTDTSPAHTTDTSSGAGGAAWGEGGRREGESAACLS